MANVKLKNNLELLGFSSNDAEVYNALLETGPTTAGPLITKTQLHRNIIYTALDHLVARKLVSTKEIKGKKHFAITTPLQLVEEFSVRTEVAKEVAEFINQKLTGELQEITVHQGNEEFLALLTSIIKTMPKGAVKYVIGTGGEAFMAATMRPIWKKYHETALRQGIKIKMLAYESQRAAISTDIEPLRALYDVRYLAENIENPAGVHIYPEANTILNIIYSDEHNPVTAIKIKNAALVQGNLHLFKNLWEMGKN